MLWGITKKRKAYRQPLSIESGVGLAEIGLRFLMTPHKPTSLDTWEIPTVSYSSSRLGTLDEQQNDRRKFGYVGSFVLHERPGLDPSIYPPRLRIVMKRIPLNKLHLLNAQLNQGEPPGANNINEALCSSTA